MFISAEQRGSPSNPDVRSAANLEEVNEPSVPDPSSADPAPSSPPTADAPDNNPIDLDAIERDLTDVQTALERLNDGSYWTDEVTGEPIADDVLVAHPTARTATPTLS